MEPLPPWDRCVFLKIEEKMVIINFGYVSASPGVCLYHLFNWRVFKNRSSLWHLTMYSNVYPKLITINKYVMYITLKSQYSLERWIKNACKATKGYSHDVKRESRRVNRTSLPNVLEKWRENFPKSIEIDWFYVFTGSILAFLLASIPKRISVVYVI